MGLMKRAWLYVTRKKGRSILLFALLLVMATFALAGLSVRAGAEDAAQEVRESLGSSFKLEVYVDYNDESLWTVMPVEGTTDTVGIYASPEYVTDDLIENIVRVEGIRAHNAETRLPVYTGDLELRHGLEYYMSRDPGRRPEQRRELKAWSKTADLYGEDSSELSDLFRIGAFEIAEGRHIMPEDSDKVLISEDTAKRNGLAVGDRIRLELRRFLFEFGVGLEEVLSDPFTPEIVGIYKINFAQEPSEDTPDSMLPENYIFCDTQMAQRMSGYVSPKAPYYDSAMFFVDDPQNMESVIDRVKAIEGVDWDYLEITQDDTAYQAEIAPLEAASGFATVLVVLLLAGCAAVIFLILMMWTRSRRREMGILRAAGIKKSAVIRQFLSECLLIAAAALAVSFFLAGIVAGPLGAAAAGTAVRGGGQEFKTTVDFDEGMTTVERVSAGVPAISYRVGAGNFWAVCAVDVGIIILSVGISAESVLRMSPRRILEE